MIKECGIFSISLFILILLFSHTNPVSNSFDALAQNSIVSNPPPNTTGTIGGIKIISPEKGSNVPIDLNSPFIIKGISKDTAATDCQVSVIVNNVKPYQKAQPMNKNGDEDYSEWQFTLTKNYTNIIEGANKITSKFSCLNNPQSSHYSVNVTGVNSPSAVSNVTSPAVSNVTSPAVSNVTSPAVSNLTIQQPTSQIQAPSENSRSEPICCKSIGHSGGSSNNSDEIASASEDKKEVEAVSTASFVGAEDKEEVTETAPEEEVTDNDNQNFQDDFTLDDFLGNNDESNDWSDDSMGFALQNEIMNEVESDLQAAGINIDLN
ncbi:MAG TPA: hypothetical protein VER14_04230 [Phototrophicaceae bacterium]|nr:hypothetical protein [Phototrophicaceae bacterium]